MPYCTKQDFLDRFGMEELLLLTDRENVGGVDDTVLNRALADATAEIDGYVAVRYPLPLASVPPRLAQVACDITRYHLYAVQATDTVKERYGNAVKYLQALANGDVKLVGQSGATEETAGVAEFESCRSVFKGGGF